MNARSRSVPMSAGMTRTEPSAMAASKPSGKIPATGSPGQQGPPPAQAPADACGRQLMVSGVVIVHRQGQLPEVFLALYAGARAERQQPQGHGGERLGGRPFIERQLHAELGVLLFDLQAL